MEGEMVILQDLVLYEVTGEDENGKLIAHHKSTGLRPAFWDRARYFGLESDLQEAMDGLASGE